jgi:hypothetical protein
MKLVKFLFFFTVIFVPFLVQAQYITTASGNWDNPSTWNLGMIPTSANGTITINHNVTIPSGYSVTIDQTTVNATLTINSGGLVTLADGSGVDLAMAAGSSLIVNGEFIRNNISTLNQNVSSLASFGSGSIYRHRYQNADGSPPLATWDAGSNFYIEGYSSSSQIDFFASNWDQTFGNIIYNCTAQKALVNFNGLIIGVQGSLSFLSTGSSITQLTSSGETIDVVGDLNISGTSRVNFGGDGIGGILNIAGNFNFTSTSSLGSYLTDIGSFTMNVTGDFIMNSSSGKIFMAGATADTGTSTINLYKNFTLTSGTITEAGPVTANGNINFVGTGSFTFVNTGSVLNLINYYIGPNVSLDLATYPITAGSGSSFTLDGGTIICGSLEPTGAIRSSTTLGNIRTATRTYNSGSIIYRGVAAQIMGDGQPSVGTVTTIIDNANGVSLYQGTTGTITIDGPLQLESGVLFIGTRTLSLIGTVSYNTGTLGGNSNSVLSIGGTTGGSIGSLNFDPANNVLGTLTLNRTGASASASVSSTVIVNSQLNLTNGSLNNNFGLTVANGCVVTRYPEASLLVNRLSHNVSDLYSVTYRTASATGSFVTGLELPSSADDALDNLTINTFEGTDFVTLVQDLIINGTAMLTKGVLNPDTYTITMQGATWFDNAGNFTPATGLVIFDGNTSVDGSSTPLLGNVQLNSGKTLTFTKDINLSGNLDFKSGSTFDAGTFVVTLNGSALQTISANGGSFFDVTCSKTGGSDVTLLSNMNLLGVLRFTTTDCDFQSNGFLTLISTSDAVGTATSPNSAQIYRLISGNIVTGDVTVQRYMSGEGRIYRYLSSPVSNASVASWKDDFAITGTFTDRSSGQTICGARLAASTPSLYYYDETAIGDANAGYVAYPASGLASANPLIVGSGYAAFVRECVNPTVVDVTGPVNQGTITFGITYTDTGDDTADGYNLIGNPYPCTVDWDAGWSKTRVSNVIAIRDNLTGVFRYWDGTIGGIPNGEIAIGQGFWIRATDNTPILRITESSKVLAPDQSAEFFREALPTDYMTLSLTDGKIKDKAYVKVNNSSTNALDDWDAPKMDNEIFDLYTTADNIPLAINSLNNISCSTTFVLGIKDMEKKAYTLSIDDAVGIFGQFNFTLIDNYKNQEIELTDSYQFLVDSNPLSSSKDRFLLKVSPKISVAPVDITYNGTICKPDDAAILLTSSINGVDYQLTDENNQLLYSTAGNGSEISFDIAPEKLTGGLNKFTVKSNSICGVLDSKDVEILIEQLPEFSMAGSKVCGAGSASLTAINVPDGYSVNWFASAESADIISTGLNFETPSLNKTTTYYASVLSVNGCLSSRKPATANIVNIDAPVITLEGSNILNATASGNIQWYYNDEPIEDAVSTSLVVNRTGIYSIQTTVEGCSTISSYEFLVTGMEAGIGSTTPFYPNPVERYLYLKDRLADVHDVSFIDNLGKTRPANAIRQSDLIRIDMENFSSGIYYLQLLEAGKITRYKILKK